MTYGIYCIEHIDSGRRYIGKSKDIERRIRDHKATGGASAAAWSRTYLSAAFRKYGWDAFRWWVVEEVVGGADVLAARELFWIDAYGVFGSGFNTKRESAGVTEFSQSVKDKIATTLRGRPLPPKMVETWSKDKTGAANSFFGKTHTLETRQKLATASAVRWKDPEYVERMKARPHGRGNKGQKASEATRAKQSAAKLGKPPPNKGTVYTGGTLERMRLGYEKRSVMQAARKLKGLDTVDLAV